MTVTFLPNIIDPEPDEVIKSEKPTVVFLARLDPYKRPWLFVELARHFPHVEFIFLGKPHFQGEGAWEPDALPDNVQLMGHVDGEEKVRILSSAWVLINTSINEFNFVRLLAITGTEEVLSYLILNMKLEETLVSIIINNYNYGRFLPEAIESALAQTYPNIEIIVVDDGSTDESHEVIRSYEEKIIPVLKENGGQASAFNAGFQASKGQIICFLDADDYYLVEKLSRIVDLFHQYPNAGWIFHDLAEVNIKNFPLKISENHCIKNFEYVDLREIILKGQLLNYWFPATTGLCFKRDNIKQILPMPDQFVISSDAFLRLAAIHLSPGILSPEKLAIHRSHGNNFYAFKKDIGVERSKLYIKVAYYLRNRFPETQDFTDQLLANSLSQLINYTSLNEALQLPEYQEYLKYYPQLIYRLNLMLKIIFTHTKIQVRKILNGT